VAEVGKAKASVEEDVEEAEAEAEYTEEAREAELGTTRGMPTTLKTLQNLQNLQSLSRTSVSHTTPPRLCAARRAGRGMRRGADVKLWGGRAGWRACCGRSIRQHT
jgi:hypothetical protein